VAVDARTQARLLAQLHPPDPRPAGQIFGVDTSYNSKNIFNAQFRESVRFPENDLKKFAFIP